MKEIRWGIIGCGKVTEVKSGPAFNLATGSCLVAVMRRDAAKAEAYARRHGVPKWYDDANQLIHDPEVDAVYIAAPPDTHLEYTLGTADAGKPVYVEKPMARNYKECLQMIEACEKRNAPLYVAYYRRRLPAFLKIKELVESGALGEARMVNTDFYYPVRREDRDRENLPWRVIPEIAGGGYFFDLASHQLDFLDYLLGPIETVRGYAVNQAGLYPAEDVVSASFCFKNGVMGNGMWCFTVPKTIKTDRTEIVGSKGRITYSTFNNEPVRLETDNGQEVFHLPKPRHVQLPLIQTVVDALLGRGTCPSTGYSAARTSWVMDRIVGNEVE